MYKVITVLFLSVFCLFPETKAKADNLFQDCKIAKTNGYAATGIYEKDVSFLMCAVTIQRLIQTGQKNCSVLKILKRQSHLKLENRWWLLLASDASNVNWTKVSDSFLRWADNNPDKKDQPVVLNQEQWLASKWQCK